MASDVDTTSSINPLGRTQLGGDGLGDDTLNGSRDTQTEPSDERPSRLETGAKIGRYVYLELIGRGGMGMVIAAYDPELDRRVAIKLVEETIPTSHHRQRMRREAMAMAMLSHPNVVAVYEVGEHEGQLFVAMEYVKGIDLARWLRERKPGGDWRSVLEVFLQAGQGLAAALLVESGEPPRRLGQGRFTLARAPWDAPEGRGRDRERALTLAQQARDDLRSAPNSEDELAQVEAFLAEHVI